MIRPAVLSDRKLARGRGLALFCGGAVGYLAYDAVRGSTCAG